MDNKPKEITLTHIIPPLEDGECPSTCPLLSTCHKLPPDIIKVSRGDNTIILPVYNSANGKPGPYSYCGRWDGTEDDKREVDRLEREWEKASEAIVYYPQEANDG